MVFVTDTDLAATGAGLGANMVGFAQDGIGAVPRSAMEKLRDTVSVRDFGAVMDIVSASAATANAAALANALATGKRVLVPKGRFYINSTVDLPNRFALFGDGPQVSTIYFGMDGQLRCQGSTYNDLAGDASVHDLGFAIIDPGNSITQASVSFLNVTHIKFDRCLFYHIQILLDSHHYVTFMNCRFFGSSTDLDMKLLSRCTSQPDNGFQNISENLKCIDCWFSSFPVELIDTVEPMFLNTQHFGGPFGVRSYRQNSLGSMPGAPFFMGPILMGCTLDSVRGVALDVDFGGTNCRAIGCFFSGGRMRDDALDPANTMGVRFTNSVGVELLGCHFEWCGNDALRLANCEDMLITGCTFLNQATGSGINSTSCQRLKITSNTFLQRQLFGGSQMGVNGNAGTEFGIVTPASDLQDSIVVGNTFSGMTAPSQIYIEGPGTRVFANPGAPLSTERGWAPATDTGWTAATGPAFKGAYATYVGQTQPTTYNQSAMQSIDDVVRNTSQRLKAFEDALRANRIIT